MKNMKKIAIYLAGSIKKDHEKEEASFWSEDNINQLKSSLQSYALSFLNQQLHLDKPMQEIIEAHEELKNRIMVSCNL